MASDIKLVPKFRQLKRLIEELELAEMLREEIKAEMLRAENPQRWAELKIAAKWIDTAEGLIREGADNDTDG